MLKEDRHSLILKKINDDHSIRIEELEKELNVSGETIRRDLINLEMQGLLRRVHGGAVLDSSTTNEFQVGTRSRTFVEEKQAISSAASDMVREGEAVAVIASTTTSYMGAGLARKNNLTLVTNSIQLAQQVGANESNRVILTGGELWASDQKLMGSLSESGMRNHRVDKVFFSATGISFKHGITEYNSREAEITKAALSIGRKIILLNDHSKFEALAFCRVAEASEVNEIITDWKTSGEIIAEYEKAGIKIHKAKKV